MLIQAELRVRLEGCLVPGLEGRKRQKHRKCKFLKKSLLRLGLGDAGQGFFVQSTAARQLDQEPVLFGIAAQQVQPTAMATICFGGTRGLGPSRPCARRLEMRGTDFRGRAGAGRARCHQYESTSLVHFRPRTSSIVPGWPVASMAWRALRRRLDSTRCNCSSSARIIRPGGASSRQAGSSRARGLLHLPPLPAGAARSG